MYATQDPQSPPAPSHRRETSSRVRAPQRTSSTTSRSEIPRQMQTIIGSVPLELREGTYPILKVDFKYLSHASPNLTPARRAGMHWRWSPPPGHRTAPP